MESSGFHGSVGGTVSNAVAPVQPQVNTALHVIILSRRIGPRLRLSRRFCWRLTDWPGKAKSTLACICIKSSLGRAACHVLASDMLECAIAQMVQRAATKIDAGSDSDNDKPPPVPALRLPPTRTARRPLRAGAATRYDPAETPHALCRGRSCSHYESLQPADVGGC